MTNQPQNFNAEMRRAKDPHNPPGGSTAIRGKQPTVHASGFMITNVNPEPTPPHEPDQDATDPTPRSVRPHHAQPLVPRAAWMLESDGRSDEQADADWRRACDSLLGTQLTPHNVSASACTEPASPPPRRSFFDEEYVSGRRVPSPPSEEIVPSQPIGFVPIPYPHIPNESIDDEADRYGRCVDRG
jgi:hypothetical protein